jgi:hypothetical protein
MAYSDNDYQEGASLAGNYPFVNPYAKGGILRPRIDKIDKCQMLASIGYTVAVGGATTTITPITGNETPDLDFYRVEITDNENPNRAMKSLDLNNRSTPFVVDTSILNPALPWTLFFFGNEDYQTGDAGCRLDYCKDLGIIGVTGGSGDTIPSIADWENVSFRLRLQDTDDLAFTLFPSGGVKIKDGSSINLNDYTTSPKLVNTGSYRFYLDMRRITKSPIAQTPTPASTAAYSAFTDTVTFPWAVSKGYTQVLESLTIATGVAGAQTGTMTVLVPGEGTKPSVSFTINIDVA